MGNEIFGIDLAGIIGDAIGDQVFPVTITRERRGARDPNNLTGGRQPLPPLQFKGTGFWEDFDGRPSPGITVELNDRRGVLIGDTFDAGALPALRNDQITVHEPMGDLSLFVKGPVSRDPAGAVYVYQCGDRRGPDGV
jgi:hypothetical protein